MMNGGGRRVLGARPVDERKAGDEDLLLFDELQKREKDRIVSLLQPVSDDFEPNSGNLAFYRMSSGKRGSGFEFTAETDKNDFDWLKTPPATPLFQSLDMEANAPDLILQRQIPIIQPVSRFSTNSNTVKASNVERPKSANPKPKVLIKSIMSTMNQTVTHLTSGQPETTKNQDNDNKRPTTAELKSSRKPQQSTNQKSTQLTSDQAQKPKSQLNFLAVNLSKTVNGPVTEPKTKPRSRGVSPQVRRSMVPPQNQSQPSDQNPPIIVLSNETPPNLRTDRSISATRGRRVTNAPDRSTSATRFRPAASVTLAAPQKQEPVGNKAVRRQSCSPSVTRGRKVDNPPEVTGAPAGTVGGGQVFGSKMVDKLMNARKSVVVNHEKKEIRTVNDGSGGFGRFLSKNSTDMPINHVDIKKDPFGSRRFGSVEVHHRK